MVKILLESEAIDIGMLNSDKKACYEAYNDQFGFDEAASIVEKMHLNGKQARNDDLLSSSLALKDLNRS